MIISKNDLKQVLIKEKEMYKEIGYKGILQEKITHAEIAYIWKYIKFLRKEEYYINRNDLKVLYKILFITNRRKKNKLGLKLGLNIPPNVFEEGLLIYHANGIVVNKNAKVGKNCKIHGDLCIGNNGITEDAPIIGDDVDIGIGAKIIGNVTIGNNVKIGANAVVTKSFSEEDIVIAGIPAVKIK